MATAVPPDDTAAVLGSSPAVRKGGSRKTADQVIYDSIYEAVLTQRLPPGSRLPEVALGELFGVSRSIVRKALTRLASDHVIEQRPNQMATVAKPGVDETRQIFEARRAIEGEVMRIAAGALSKAKLKQLRKLAEAEKEAHEGGRDQDRVHHSMAIHLFLANNCPNQVLGRMTQELVLRTSIVIALYKAPGISACFLGDDHTRIVDLIEQGDGETAARLIHNHLRTLENLLDLSDESHSIDLASILRP